MVSTSVNGGTRLALAAALSAVLLAMVGAVPVAAATSTRFPTSNTAVTLPNPRPQVSDPENAYADDGVYASGDLTGKVIGGVNSPGEFAQAYGDFGFNAIPANAVITSVTAEMQYKFQTTGAANLNYAILLFSGADAFSGTVLSFATGTAEPTSDTVLATAPVVATRAQLLDGALGVEVSGEASFGPAQAMLIDYISVTVAYTVPNQAPVLAPIGPQTVGAGTIKTVHVSASDGDGDALQFGIGSHPSFVLFTDNGDGTATMTLQPVAGDIAGSPYTVRVGVTDGTDSDYENVVITVVADTTPPAVTVPADITTEATGPSGAIVNFTAFGTDAVDGDLNATCAPASGSTFPLGETTVSCEAVDLSGNTGSATFKVTVVDTTPPDVVVPPDVQVAATGPGGAVATYGPVTATDLVDGNLTPTCDPPSGSAFPLGATTVTCSATDNAGNPGVATFTVTVSPPEDPRITVPADIRVTASGTAGARVSFEVTAIDDQDGPLTPTCTPPSGSLFAIGTTTVHCTVTDSDRNTANASFTVTVQPSAEPVPTEPPTDTVGPAPADRSASGLGLTLAVLGMAAFLLALARPRGRRR